MDVKPARIELQSITAGYRSLKRPIISNLNLTISEGNILTILGPNGAGKSTLLRCIVGILQPTSGRILIDGDDLGTLSPSERARRLALVSQNEQSAFALSVEEIVLTGRAAHLGLFGRPGGRDRALAAEALELMGIKHLGARSFADLSGGERQLARIARALVQQSPVLILDEPTAHLDLANQMQVLRAIRRLVAEKCTVVMTSHDPQHALLCGGLVMLIGPDGRAHHGAASEMLTASHLSDLYKIPLALIEANGRKVVTVDLERPDAGGEL